MTVLRAPFHQTVGACVALEERERIERLDERGKLVRLAYLANYAFAAQGKPGDALAQEQRSYETLLGIWPHTLEDGEAVNDREAELLHQLLSAIYRDREPSTPPVS